MPLKNKTQFGAPQRSELFFVQRGKPADEMQQRGLPAPERPVITTNSPRCTLERASRSATVSMSASLKIL